MSRYVSDMAAWWRAVESVGLYEAGPRPERADYVPI